MADNNAVIDLTEADDDEVEYLESRAPQRRVGIMERLRGSLSLDARS
jgi:hypothetical protein